MGRNRSFLSEVLFVLFFFACLSVQAQKPHVEAEIDSVGILIGEQAHLTLSVTAPERANIVYPDLKPRTYLVPGVEIVDDLGADTSKVDGGMLRISRVFSITSFDEALYPITPIVVKVDGKEYKSQQLALKVITMDVDTLHPEQFFPPKDIQNNPFSLDEWLGVLRPYALLCLLLAALFYNYLCLRSGKPITIRLRKIRRIPAHTKALDAIEQIKGEKLVNSENVKDYYTRLTDTLREYMRERFGFNAMEMTSSEIIEHLQSVDDPAMIDELRHLFQTADLVKFAKYSTLINENDMNLVNAIEFIDKTKTEAKVEEIVTEDITDEERKLQAGRKTLKIVMAVLAVNVAVLLGVVCYRLFKVLY